MHKGDTGPVQSKSVQMQCLASVLTSDHQATTPTAVCAINVLIPVNGLRVNQFNFNVFHSMWKMI